MREFRDNQRVLVTDTDHPLVGMFGTVARLRRCDECAWVRMDSRPLGAKECFPFLADDPSGRGTHTLLHPDQCEPSAKATGGKA